MRDGENSKKIGRDEEKKDRRMDMSQDEMGEGERRKKGRRRRRLEKRYLLMAMKLEV